MHPSFPNEKQRWSLLNPFSWHSIREHVHVANTAPAFSRRRSEVRFHWNSMCFCCIFMSAYFVDDSLAACQRRNDWPRGLMSSTYRANGCTRFEAFRRGKLFAWGLGYEYSSVAGPSDKGTFRWIHYKRVTFVIFNWQPQLRSPAIEVALHGGPTERVASRWQSGYGYEIHQRNGVW